MFRNRWKYRCYFCWHTHILNSIHDIGQTYIFTLNFQAISKFSGTTVP